MCYQSHFKCSVSSCPRYAEAITCQIKRRNRGNDSRCCLCICLTALPGCLWEGGGGRGLCWVNPTAVREPLLLSPLSSHVVAVSSFLDVRLRDVHMSPCLLEFGLWNIKNLVSIPETFLSDTPWSSWSCIAPRGLRNISPLLPYATLSIFASTQGEANTVILQRKKLKWCMCTCGIYTYTYLGFLPHPVWNMQNTWCTVLFLSHLESRTNSSMTLLMVIP